MDLVTNLLQTAGKHDAILVFVDRYLNMACLAPTTKQCTREEAAHPYVDYVYRMHGLLRSIASDRDPRFKAKLWQQLFGLPGYQVEAIHSISPTN